MKIALLGYGKMGKTIERIAIQNGHTISLTIDNAEEWKNKGKELKNVDVAIDFSTPENIISNIEYCFSNNIPLVVGTTAWYDKIDILKEKCIKEKQSFLWASNFSIGVNIFFKINQELAKLMNKYDDYHISIEEIHHTAKLDSPSGTAISLAKDIIKEVDRKSKWELDNQTNDVLNITAKRIDPVPGTHSITYESDIDKIEIVHTAKSRDGFAKGAIVAAEWLVSNKGWHEFKDVFF